eukprot:CAMPEP_0194497446 /NCGR_PEP_ID=MMETSP0253-20130528/14387_1 /TAXON_ID=2966 /ORGANISM="Noctiluca scintillans" /LENGTH=140 /DNA_ID=CAMNT_0039338949 /DNA_START=82 /DNA_END=505 /DNA_ORIENTATION=-
MVAGPPPRAGSFQYVEGVTLRVTGLAQNTRNTDLQAGFAEFGHVMRIQVLQGKGIAFVEFRDKDDAHEALSSMDGNVILGREIAVSMAGPPPDPRRRADLDDGDPHNGSRRVLEAEVALGEIFAHRGRVLFPTVSRGPAA